MPRRDQSLDELQYSLPLKRYDQHGNECSADDQPFVFRKHTRTRRVPKKSKEMRFRSLHHHSTFSFLDGYQLPEAHVRRAVEIEMPSLALTEHGNISSHVQLEKAALKEGIKPIFGVELYAGGIGEDATQRKNHLTILAQDAEGYRNLLRLVSRTYSEGFYYEPTASGRMLREHRKGLVVLSGCQSSLLATSLIGGKNIAPGDASLERGLQCARNFQSVFGDAYYLEVQAFPELEDTCRINGMIAEIHRKTGIPMVASFDCHYTVPEEREIQQVLHNIRPGERRTLEEMSRDWGYNANLCPPWTDDMVLRKLVATGLTRQEAINAILATVDISDSCNVELPSLPMVRYPLPRGYSDGVELWRAWLKDGWRYRGCHKLPPAELERYKERLRHETKIIEDKDFVDYFLVVSDAVRWAKDHDIAVGPARGSAAGSLACWLLRITEVNPMLYPDLVFERFIDVTRQDLPDIDLDFDSQRRGEVREYLVAKYGPEQVGQVANFAKFKAKNSLDDAARVYHVPKWEIDKIKDVLIERSSGDLRASATIEDTAEQFDIARDVFERYPDLAVATELEGNYKQLSIHAAGLVISTGPLDEVCAIYSKKTEEEVIRVISMDKYDAEQKGLLKLDFLGLSTVTMLNNCRMEMGWSLDDLYNLDLEDEESIAAFHRNDVTGIFQIEGRACRYVNGALQPDNFYEVCLVNALGRPGPLHNGAANDYIDIKMGRKEPEAAHPVLFQICEKTYGQIVYQEQILRILGEIGNFDWTHRAEVRRIISRKIGEQAFNRKWEQFRDGAMELHGMEEEVSAKIWGECITAGSYAFNASHSVSYGMLSLQSQWFKQHETELFFQEALKIRDKDGQKILLRDGARGHRPRKPIEVVNPNPRTSGITWTRTKPRRGKPGTVRAGFDEIPGVGVKVATKIIDYRDEHGLDSWDDLININGIGPKTVEKMKEFVTDDDPFRAMWLDRAILHTKEEIASGKLGPLPYPTHVAMDLPYSRGSDIEVVWLGTIWTRNVRDLFEYNRAKKGVELKPEEVKDPHLNEWCVMVGDDESDQMGLRVDRYRYPKWRELIWKIRPGKDLVLVRGLKPGWMPTRQIDIRQMWLIDPEM